MGLWGSKQKKELNISSNEIFVTEDALTNVIKNAKDKTTDNKQANDQQQQQPATTDLKLSTDLYEKRLVEYEKNLINGFNSASKEVESLFRDRYQTLPVCFDLQKSVSDCYTENAKLPLKCVDIANQFLKCVEKERQSKIGLPPTNLNTSKA